MKDMELVRTEVLNGLTALITWYKALIACKGHVPGVDSEDASQEWLDDQAERVIKLRKIREQFEDVFD